MLFRLSFGYSRAGAKTKNEKKRQSVCIEQPRTDRVPCYQNKPPGTKKNPEREKRATETAKNHGGEPPHSAPPSTPAYDPPPAETATTCITGAAGDAEDGGASTAPTPRRAAAEPGGTAAAPPPRRASNARRHPALIATRENSVLRRPRTRAPHLRGSGPKEEQKARECAAACSFVSARQIKSKKTI
jgi:hypothetical protein